MPAHPLFFVTQSVKMGSARFYVPTLYGGCDIGIRVQIRLFVKIFESKALYAKQRGPEGRASLRRPRGALHGSVKTLIVLVVVGEKLPQLRTVEYLSVDVRLCHVFPHFATAFGQFSETERPIKFRRLASVATYV